MNGTADIQRRTPFWPGAILQLRLSTLFLLTLLVAIYLSVLNQPGTAYLWARLGLHVLVVWVGVWAQLKRVAEGGVRMPGMLLAASCLLGLIWHLGWVLDARLILIAPQRFDRLALIAVANFSFSVSFVSGCFYFPEQVLRGVRRSRRIETVVWGGLLAILLIAALSAERYATFLGGLDFLEASLSPVERWSEPAQAADQLLQRWFGPQVDWVLTAWLVMLGAFGWWLHAVESRQWTQRVAVLLFWIAVMSVVIELLWNMEVAPALLGELFRECGFSWVGFAIALAATLIPVALWFSYVPIVRERGAIAEAVEARQRIRFAVPRASWLLGLYLVLDFGQYGTLSAGGSVSPWRDWQQMLPEYLANGAISIYILPAMILALRPEASRGAAGNEGESGIWAFSLTRFGWSFLLLLGLVPLGLISLGRWTIAAVSRLEDYEFWLDRLNLFSAGIRYFQAGFSLLLLIFLLGLAGFWRGLWDAFSERFHRPNRSSVESIQSKAAGISLPPEVVRQQSVVEVDH